MGGKIFTFEHTIYLAINMIKLNAIKVYFFLPFSKNIKIVTKKPSPFDLSCRHNNTLQADLGQLTN